jgi:hypothetical protein
MLELRNIFKRCNSRSLVLGDELCRGTESVSGKSIVAAGIWKLRKSNSQFIFATHLHGLDDIPEVKILEHVEAYHLSVKYDKQTDKLIYDRKMKKGSGSSLYGLEVCKAMDMDNEFLELANKIRKREAGEYETLLGDEKKSQYNNNIYMDKCEICGNKAEETHHIKYQKDADNTGFVGHVHKNNQSNLVPLCKECHKKETYGKINIIGWQDTSNGRRLQVVDNRNIIQPITQPITQSITQPVNNTIDGNFNKTETETEIELVKGFKYLTIEQYNYIKLKLHEYSHMTMIDLLDKLNSDCTIMNFECTKHILRKVKKIEATRMKIGNELNEDSLV